MGLVSTGPTPRVIRPQLKYNHACHMKYTIILNQLVLAFTKLDIIEGAILDYLYFICTTPNEKIEKERIDGFTWVNYKHLIKDMPLLRIKSKGAITPRIKKIEKAGYIATKIVGQKMYIKILSKIDELFTNMNGLNPKHSETVHQNEQRAIHENEHDNNTNSYKNNVNVTDRTVDKLSDSQKSKLQYLLERIGDQKNIRAWMGAVKQIGFQKVENILLDVSESTDAKNKGACAMGLAKKAGFKIFYRPNKDRL